MANAPQLRRLRAGDYPPDVGRLVDVLNPFLNDVAGALGGGLTDNNMQWVMREVGLTYPATVTAPTLASGWTASTTEPVGYWREGSTVFLRGSLSGGTYGSGALFTLPAGYLPAQAGRFAVGQSSVYEGVGNVTISTAGAVVAPEITSVQSGASTYLRLDGISFAVGDSSPVDPGVPFPLTATVPFKPESVFVVGCWNAQGDAADLPGLRWTVVLSGGTYALSVRDFPGLTAGQKYTVRLAVLGF